MSDNMALAEVEWCSDPQWVHVSPCPRSRKIHHRTGRIIQTVAAKSNIKNVILELGGKSPAIMFEDVDLDSAVLLTAQSIQSVIIDFGVIRRNTNMTNVQL